MCACVCACVCTSVHDCASESAHAPDFKYDLLQYVQCSSTTSGSIISECYETAPALLKNTPFFLHSSACTHQFFRLSQRSPGRRRDLTEFNSNAKRSKPEARPGNSGTRNKFKHLKIEFADFLWFLRTTTAVGCTHPYFVRKLCSDLN